MDHILFIHSSSMEEHLGCYHLLALVNNAVLNGVLQVSVPDSQSLLTFVSFGGYCREQKPLRCFQQQET